MQNELTVSACKKQCYLNEYNPVKHRNNCAFKVCFNTFMSAYLVVKC